MIFEKVVNILANYKDCDPSEITEITTLESLELDSLDVVELVMNIEEEFEISIEVDENIKTVGDMVNLIKAAQN